MSLTHCHCPYVNSELSVVVVVVLKVKKENVSCFFWGAGGLPLLFFIFCPLLFCVCCFFVLCLNCFWGVFALFFLPKLFRYMFLFV